MATRWPLKSRKCCACVMSFRTGSSPWMPITRPARASGRFPGPCCGYRPARAQLRATLKARAPARVLFKKTGSACPRSALCSSPPRSRMRSAGLTARMRASQRSRHALLAVALVLAGATLCCLPRGRLGERHALTAGGADSSLGAGSRRGVLVPARAHDTSSAAGTCAGKANVEYWGDVVVWGSNLRVASAMECCRECHARSKSTRASDKPCNTWTYCPGAQWRIEQPGYATLCATVLAACLQHASYASLTLQMMTRAAATTAGSAGSSGSLYPRTPTATPRVRRARGRLVRSRRPDTQPCWHVRECSPLAPRWARSRCSCGLTSHREWLRT